MTGAYRYFLDELNIKVNTAVELGSRDAKDAIAIADRYGCHVVCWEANPPSIEVCEFVIGNREDITLVKKAVWSENTTIPFYPVVNGNIGASSAFKADPSYPYERRYQQKEIYVEAQRLDDWWGDRPAPELLCMDLQGGELEALKGCGDLLNDIQVIVTEGQYRPLYHNTPVLKDLEEYLKQYDFHLVTGRRVNDWFGDFLFVKGYAWSVQIENRFHYSPA
jgi:FkbM family methyltransferase